VSHCENCPVKDRCPAVPPTLNAINGRSDLLIVGEGPGREEVRVGKGFQGPSGRLLRTALTNAGFTGEVVASMTNATLCQPPKEGVSPAMVGACRERLLAEVAQVNPRVVLALGKWATRSLLGRDVKITAISGLPREWEGRWLVPSIHPASVLRHGNEMTALQTAVDVAMNLVRGEGAAVRHPGETEYKVIESDDDLKTALIYLGKFSNDWLLGCDIETTGLNPRTNKIVALGVSPVKNRVMIFPGEMLELPAVRLFLSSPRYRFAWHNGQFDVGFLRAAGVNARIDEDTLLLHYCLDEQKGTHDLEQVAARYLGARDYKDEVSAYRKGGWWACPKETLFAYLARDCDYTRQLVDVLGTEVAADPGLEGLYRSLLLPAADLLTEVSANGIYFNTDEARRVAEALVPRKEEALVRLRALTGDDINPASQPQVYELIYERLRLRPPPRFQRDTREETLTAIAATAPPEAQAVVAAVLEFRGIAKMLSTSIGGLLKRVDPTTGRIHPGFLLHSTVTGRLSSREPNGQNVDKDPLIRNCFQAPEGRLLMEADLDQAELRVLANFSGDPALAAIYREGRSLHKEVALALYGEGYTEDEYRQAKSLNFGICYGLQAEGLVKKFGGPTMPKESRITLPQAQERIDKWAATFPAAWDYLQRQKAAVEIGKATEVRSPTGRLRRFRHVTERTLADAGNESCNFGIQATASDVCLSAAIALRPFVNERGGKIIALIHDSVLLELPDDPEPVREIASETARQFAEFGTRFASGEVRITCSFKVGRQWGALEKYDAHLS
jgi:uracil-DNA glycosylase family 4